MSVKKPQLLLGAGLILFALVLFRVVWPDGVVIHSADYNFGLMAMYKSELPGAFTEGFWRGFPLLGRAGSTPPTFTNLTLAILPIEIYMDWIYAIHLLLASFFLIGFLRLRGLGWIPSAAGALSAFWLGSNLTLIHPGHLLKYGVLLCAAATLFFLEKRAQTRDPRWAILAGGALGWMFMHQADLALFFGLLLGAYHLFRETISERSADKTGKRMSQFALHSVLLLAVAGLLVWEAYKTQMETQVRSVEVLQQGSEQEKWDFATQWSFPPGESLDLIAPGYWGWTSSHLTAPYHGITGQSPQWRTARQGSPNFRMESVYVGLLPLGLALLAALAPRTSRKEVIFWGAALAVTLLLSFGKFTPLYRLFFQLPLVNVIRNPNKFLQVFQLCLGVLCAFGLQTLLTSPPRIRKAAAGGFLAGSLLLGAGSLLISPTSADQLSQFAGTVWDSRAEGILQNRQLSMLHASVAGGLSALLVVGLSSPRFRTAAGTGLVLLLMADGLLLGRHYLKPAPVGFLEKNALAEFLVENLGEQRVSFLQTDPLSSFYMTHLFPAHGIAFADTPVAPRLDEAYQDYFDRIGNNRIRYWQEFGVKYVLATRSSAEALFQQAPALRGILQEVWSYTLTQSAPGVLEIIPGAAEVPGQQVVLELMLPSDRFQLVAELRTGPPPESPPSPLTVVYTEDPAVDAFSASGETGRITGVLSTSSGFLIQAEVDAPRAVLRLADKADPALRARVNGGPPQSLITLDGLFAGLELPAGLHKIEIAPDLPRAGRLLQACGLLLCLGTAGSLLLSTRKPYA